MFDSHANFAQSLIAAVPVDRLNGTDFELMPGDESRFSPNMPVTMWPDETEPTFDNAEIGYITSLVGTAATILRGQEGSIRKEVQTGWRIQGSITVKTISDIEDAVLTKADAADVEILATDLASKASAEPGMGLSSNDYTTDDKTKLAGIAPGATQNDSDAALRDRSTHTGSQPISSVTGLQTALDGKQELGSYATTAALGEGLAGKSNEGHLHDDRYFTESEVTSLLTTKQDTVPGKSLSTNDFTSAYMSKLDGIAPGATANATDSQLRDRATHTGVQPIESVTGLSDAITARVSKTGDTMTGQLTVPAVTLLNASAINMPDGGNLVAATGTGTRIGTATNQKLGFFNATPVVQQGATADLLTVLSALGLRASGTAAPITTSGAVALTGSLRYGFVSVSSSTTLTTHSNVEVTAAGITITLPTAASVAGREITIINASTGAITVASTSSQTIGNTSSAATTYSHATGQSITLISNGTNWRLK